VAFGDDRAARPRSGERADHGTYRFGRDSLPARLRREPVTDLIFLPHAAMNPDHAVEVEAAFVAHRMKHIAAS
jgi:hypothetical protein